jgi:hypothetical protein
MKSSASIDARRASKRSSPTMSAPRSRRPSNLARGRLMRAGGIAGAKNSRGNGSKLSATAGRPVSRARATARPTRA